MKACMKDVARELVQMEWCGVVGWMKRNILGDLVILRERREKSLCGKCM